ncbi:RsmD family RNA methyltransferase [Nocardioides sp. Bht2]|uniref:RsmD family RNA methyltransferase n=1 Tax=Nocardioides sp. Bht2 TaxID=3392297 RepID=UPI0039B6E960
MTNELAYDEHSVSGGVEGTYPVQQVLFGGLAIQFDDRVLEPRQWTTHQSFWAAQLMVGAPAGPVLELCAGAGQIGLLALTLSDRAGVLVDADPIACGYARGNTERAQMADRVEVRNARAEQALTPADRFAVAIIDPPWVPSSGTDRFPADPLFAIDGGPAGLDVAAECLRAVNAHLLPGGSVLIQLGTAEQLTQLLADVEDDAVWQVQRVWRQDQGRGVVAHLQRHQNLA